MSKTAAPTSIRGLKAAIHDLEVQNAQYKAEVEFRITEHNQQIDHNRKLRNDLFAANAEKDAQVLKLCNTTIALEFAVSLMAQDFTPTNFVTLVGKKAEEFGLKVSQFSLEFQDALTAAYAKAPKRAAMAVTLKNLEEIGVRPSTAQALVENLEQLANKADCGDPNCDMHERQRSRG